MLTFWFPNVGPVDGERLGSIVPVPDTPEVWGLLLALSVTVKIALRVPVAVGVKVTLMVQVAPMAKVEGQLLVCPKSPELVPVNLSMIRLPPTSLLFPCATPFASLVVPTFWPPKSGT